MITVQAAESSREVWQLACRLAAVRESLLIPLGRVRECGCGRHLLAAACAMILVFPGCKKQEEKKKPPPPTQTTQATQSMRAQYLSLLNVGKAQYENREAEKAIESFSQAVKVLPVETAGRLNLARAYLQARMNEKARNGARSWRST